MIPLKIFKREIRALGYSVRTSVVSFSDLGYGLVRSLSVYDLHGEVTCGTCSSAHLEKHKLLFSLLRKNKGKVFDVKNNLRVVW